MPVSAAINFMVCLIKIFLCFVFRRKRKGKGAKGKAKSGGRVKEKALKMQVKTPQPSPATCTASTKLPTAKESQTEEAEQADQTEGASAADSEATDNTVKSSAGLKKTVFVHEHLVMCAQLSSDCFVYFSVSSQKLNHLCLCVTDSRAHLFLTTLMRRLRHLTNRMVMLQKSPPC